MRPCFFYAAGTAYYVKIMDPIFGELLSFDIANAWRIGGVPIGPPPDAKTGTILGVNGRNASWTLEPAGDPFPTMLDPDLWEKRVIIPYPAAFAGIGQSINYGRDRIIEQVLKLKPGQGWALGGYSQGAAVCASVWMSGVKPGTSGPLESRAADFLGYVGFGSPRRQINHRGAAGEFGTWSGSWYDQDVHTGCGGSFPDDGPWARLSGCPDEWVEFTAPKDVFSSHGSSTVEQNWTAAQDILLGSIRPDEFLTLITAGGLKPVLDTVGEILGGGGYGATEMNYFIDGAGVKFPFPGGGHVTYPVLPPPDVDGVIPTVTETVDGITYRGPAGKTCYQLAIEFMDNLARPFQVAPIVLPPSAAGGWSTTLVPPAA